MLDIERRRRMTEIIREARVISVAELRARLGVSGATIRRDLARLEQSGVIDRSWGAASLRAHLDVGPQWLYDSGPNQDLKARIGKTAGGLAKPGQIVSLQSGGTMFEVARRLIRVPRLKAITNSLRTAHFLQTHGTNTEVTLVGGVLSDAGYVSGPLADLTIEQFTVDIAFVGVNAASIEHGLTTDDPSSAAMKRTFIRKARRTVLAVDHTKLGKSDHIKIEGWHVVDVLVTTKEADPGFLRAVSDCGVEILTA